MSNPPSLPIESSDRPGDGDGPDVSNRPGGARPTTGARPASPYVRHRLYWSLFLLTWGVLAIVIRWHVRGLDSEVRRKGLANSAVVACRNVLVDHIDVETGLRGHLATGHREYLRPYFEGMGRIEVDMAALRAAVAEIPDERSCFDAVAETSRGVLAEFSNQVSLVEVRGIESGRERFQKYPTKPGMDKIRAYLIAIQASEDSRLAANMRSLEVSMGTTLFLIDAFTAVVFFLVLTMATGLIDPPGEPSRWRA